MGAGVAGAVNAGGSVEGIDFEAGVVGEDEVGVSEEVAGAEGFEGGIFEKGGAGFLGCGEVGVVAEGLEVIAGAEEGAEFVNFVGVAGGDDDGEVGKGHGWGW